PVVAFPIRSIGWLLGEFPRSVVGFDRVSAVLGAEEHTPYGAERLATRARGVHLEVDGVAFAHEAGAPLLEDVSFAVEPGRSVALVGQTASGKTTLANLVTRLVDPDRGTVRVDGHDLRDLAHGELAGAVALVGQTAFLFDDTVRGNVTLDAEVSDAEVWEALRTAQADGFVAA